MCENHKRNTLDIIQQIDTSIKSSDIFNIGTYPGLIYMHKHARALSDETKSKKKKKTESNNRTALSNQLQIARKKSKMWNFLIIEN